MKEYWNDNYWVSSLKNFENKSLDFLDDIWLKKYEDKLKDIAGKKVLDLGCGLGQYSKYLLSLGFDVTSSDISIVALNKFKDMVPEAKIIEMDMSKDFPFTDNSFDLVFANLSIHYFDKETTRKVLKEIRRVLKDNGYFIGAVNSIKTLKFIEDEAVMIEPNYYQEKIKKVRLWDKEQFDYFFSDFNIEVLEEVTTQRWNKTKIQWEFVVRNRKESKMISVKDAIKLYEENNPNLKVSVVTDVGDEYVLGMLHRETGEVPDISPTAINKETGEMRIFFPPNEVDKLNNAKEIDISEL